MSEEQHVLEHKGAEGLLDWFRLAFHSDIGEGHLEHFVFADADFSDIQHIDAAPLFPVICGDPYYEQSIVESDVVLRGHSPPDIFYARPKLLANIQRGPPSYIS